MPPSTHAPTPVIVPFWKRIPAMLRYPLRSAPLMTLLVYAVIATLVSYLVFGGIVRLFVLAFFYAYAFECLLASANGEEEAPDSGMKFDSSIGIDQIKMQVLFALLLALAYVEGGWVAVYIGLGLVALAQPGANMSLATDRYLLHAINPLTWLTVMSRIPGPYLFAAVLFFVCQVAREPAIAWLSRWSPDVLAEMLVQAVMNYAVLVIFHLLGWLIWQYQVEFSYTPERKVVLKPTQSDPDQPLLDQLDRMLRAGQRVQAADFLWGQIQRNGARPALHERYRSLLRELDDRAQLQVHGRMYLSVLLAQDREKPALALLRECLETDPAFLPTQAEEAGRLARRAVLAGHYELAVDLLSRAIRNWPKSKENPGFMLFCASVLSDKLARHAQAREQLWQIRRRYRDHPIQPQVDQLMERLGPE